MTKIPARPAAAVPARPAQSPKPGNAAIPAAAKPSATPTTTQDKTVVAPSNAGTSPIVDATKGPDGKISAVVNQPASTVDSSVGVDAAANTAEGQQLGVPSKLTEGVQSELAATGAEVASTPNPGKRRGRKPGSGKGGSGAPKKTTYPGLLSTDENGAPIMVDDGKGGQYQQRMALGEVPTDFDFAKHEKLKPNDFQDEAVYCDFNAKRYADLAKAWEKKAKRIRALGSAVDQKKALKYLKMREEMQKLAAQLAADGMDVDAMEGDNEATE